MKRDFKITTWTFVVLVFGISAFGCQSRRGGEDEKLQRNLPETSASSAQHETVPVNRWPDRRRLVYSLLLTSNARFDKNAPYSTTLAGKLVVTPFVESDDRVTLVLNLVQPMLTVADTSAGPEIEAFEKELSSVYVMHLENGIRVGQERFEEGISSFAANLWRTVGSALQLKAGTSNLQEVREFDSTGEYVASYRFTEPYVVTKKKKVYESTMMSGKIRTDQRAQMLPKISDSTVEIRLADGRPASVTQHETVSSRLLNDAEVEVTTVLSLDEDETATVSMENRPAESLWNGTKAYDVKRAVDAPIDAQMFDRARIAGRTIEDLLREAEAIAQSDVPNDSADTSSQEAYKRALGKKSNVFGALSALFRQQPETLVSAEQAVLAQSSASKLLLDAAASAGTSEAQATLGRLMLNERVPRTFRLESADGLIRVASATPETTDLLTRLMRDPLLKEHAVFGIGTAARHLREQGETARSKNLVELLLKELESAKGASEKIRCLRGIANAADAGALPEIHQALLSDEVKVRVAAVDALGQIEAAAGSSMLATAMIDEDYRVRRSALRAANRHTADDVLVGGVSKAALEDQYSTVRQLAVQLLGKWLPERPELKTVIARAAEVETDPNLKAAASALL